MCGEHSGHRLGHQRARGSSPRVRGTPTRPATGWWWRRFIPACAGNTVWAIDNPCNDPVHPRVCGEHPAARRIPPPPRKRFIPACAGNTPATAPPPSPSSGSSPRVRGTLLGDPQAAEQTRFIPACAGNTVSRSSIVSSLNGSSPRVRGTPVQLAPERVYYWFIPACAGNTRPGNRRPAPDTVHPRVCGEHEAVRAEPRRDLRFIPACAGNTHPRRQSNAA